MKNIPKYVVVENRIAEAIKNREMSGKLPGERVLAKQFGVSYMTMRKAVDILVAKKVLYKIPTRGTYVTQPGTIVTMVKNIGNFLKAG